MTFDPRKTGTLAVLLKGRKIGVINRLAGDQFLFSFMEDYIEDAARPTLSLSFKSAHGAFVTSVRPVQTRLPPFFSNLLPEGQLRDYLARRAGVKPEREFFLLAVLGANLPGAVSVVPEDDSGEVVEDISHDDDRLDQGQALRFSLAGVQLKFSAIMEASGGLTIPVDGMGGGWIVKLPSFQYAHVPENEFVMMELARRVGIDVPETKLVPIADIQGLPEGSQPLAGHAFAVRRFDRAAQGNGRVHMEDFAQVFGLYPQDKYDERSYANIAFTLWTEANEESAYEFIRRLAFTVMIGNADMHLKNWSLLYPDGRKPVLSPAYDFVSTVPYLPQDRLALEFGSSRSLGDITAEQLKRFAETAHMPLRKVAEIAAETVDLTKQAWGELAQKELLPAELRQAVTRQIESVPIKA